MKTIYLILILSTIGLGSNQLFSQDYLPFPTDSAVWYSVNWQRELDPPPLYWYTTHVYLADGDTNINDLSYTKLYKEFFDDDFPRIYLGSYRVEEDNKRIYFIDSFNGTEALLYDFSLVPGDTISISGSNYDLFNLVCLDTSSVLINGFSHKSFSIYSYLPNGTECYTTWVEGIGSLREPLETDSFCSDIFEIHYRLSCFFYKEEHIYEWIENPFFTGCFDTNVSVQEHQSENSNFIISPNPVSGTSRLLSKSESNNMFDYKIFDINGKLKQSRRNVIASDIVIQRQNFSKGIHLLRLYAHKTEQYYSIKFIVN